MQYLVIRSIFFINAFYVFALLIRQIYFVDTISVILLMSQLALLIIIFFGLNSIKFQITEILLIIIVLITLLTSDFEGYEIKNIIIDFLKPIIFILTIASIRSNKCIRVLDDIKLGKIFFFYAITTSISVIVGVYHLNFINLIYPAFSSIYSLLGYFYFLRCNKKITILYFIILLLSGKRGVLVAGIVTQFLFQNSKKINLLFIFFIFLVILLILLNYESLSQFFLKKMLKIDFDILTNTSNFLIIAKNITGGRLDEIIDGLSYDFTLLNFLFGYSLGYTYDSPAFGNINHKNFHFSPASLFVNYGLIFTVLFLIYILKIIFNNQIIYFSRKYKNIYVIRMFLISCLFFFLTEYGVFGYINFCIGLGLLAKFSSNSSKKFKNYS